MASMLRGQRTEDRGKRPGKMETGSLFHATPLQPSLQPWAKKGGLSWFFLNQRRALTAAAAALMLTTAAFAQKPRIGKPAPDDKIAAMNLTVMPDGRGLPDGKGTVAAGTDLFKEKCAVCHNDHGEGRENQYPALVGGIGTINTPTPMKTVGSYWPYATTVFDYIRRAMPYDQPGTLKPDEIYSAVAFILHANGIIGENDEINKTTLPNVKMPNRNGFIPDARPDVKAKR
jgi:S-disulfanyl-L-cysteine oxidoreductase SoxD